MHRERTLQQQDPVGTGGFVRLFNVGGSIATVIAAVLVTAAESDEVANWWFEAAALAVATIAAAVHIWWCSPFHAPFRRWMLVVVSALLATAFLLDELAQLGANQLIHDDWGLVAISLGIYLFAGERPPREVLLAGLALTGTVAVAAYFVSPTIVQPADGVVRAVIAVASILPATAAATAFGVGALRRLDRLRAATPIAAPGPFTVRQQGIAELEAEVVPFFRDLVADGVLDASDSGRARRIATELRARLVADLARGWLAELGLQVDDPDGYAERMTGEQRTAIRGLIGAVPLRHGGLPGTAKLSGQDFDAVLELTIALDRRPARAAVAPPVLLLRTVFPHLAYRVEDHLLVVVLEFTATREPARR